MSAVSMLSFTTTGIPCSGPPGTGRGSLGIQRGRFLAGRGVDENECIEQRPGVVIRADPREVEVDKLNGRESAFVHCPLKLRDGRLEWEHVASTERIAWHRR